MDTSIYLLNRTPIAKLGWRIPYEMVTHQNPLLAHLHPIGCRAYALRGDPANQEKLERTHIGYLLRYSSTNIFLIWVPILDKVIRTRDVVFQDNQLYGPLGALEHLIIDELNNNEAH